MGEKKRRYEHARTIDPFLDPADAEQRAIYDTTAAMMNLISGRQVSATHVASVLASVLAQSLSCAPDGFREIMWADIKSGVDAAVFPRKPGGPLS